MKIAQIVNNRIHWIFDPLEVTGKNEIPNWPPTPDGKPITLIDVTDKNVNEGDIFDISESIKNELDKIDAESGSGRAIRKLTLELAVKENLSINENDANFNYDLKKLHEYENRAIELREKLHELEANN